MLFHTWTFLGFFVVVLVGYFGLQKTKLWLPWLFLSSYVFYGVWNPFYLILVFYSTLLDYLIVACMDGCAIRRAPRGVPGWLGNGFASSRVAWCYRVAGMVTIGAFGLVVAGPETFRFVGGVTAVIVGLIALAARYENRKVWLATSLVNNLSVLVFFKYADFLIENLNGLVLSLRSRWDCAIQWLRSRPRLRG